MKAAACCTAIACSTALSADAYANQVLIQQENYAALRRSVIDDEGMLQNFVNVLWDGTFLPGEYTVSTKNPLSELETQFTSEYYLYDTVVIDLSVNIPCRKSVFA